MTAQASHTVRQALPPGLGWVIRLMSYHEQEMQRASTAVNFRYTHFAMLCIDHNGELRVEASPSIAGCEKAIFTEDVQDRFLKSVATSWQPNLQSLHASK